MPTDIRQGISCTGEATGETLELDCLGANPGFAAK